MSTPSECCCCSADRGPLPVDSQWHWRDHLGALACRTTSRRMHYRVAPGLYALGQPDATSEVFVSANYKLSFDLLRRSLAGLNAWILVLDTKGINVWCAAGKGTFGTAELVRRLELHDLARRVEHRRLIVPQLGAVGVNAAEVERLSGFQVAFGPVRAADLKAYLQAGYRATPAMRRVTFTLRDRLVLVPLELRPALKPLLIYALLALMFCGLKPEGIIFSQAWPAAIPLLILGVAAMLAGTLLTPALLPVLPGRAFSLKGLFAGLLTTAGLMFGWPPAALDDPWLQAAALIGLPAASAYLALQFTGATPFTGISGVEQEIRATRPFYGAAVALAILGLLASKLIEWGLI